MLILDYIMIIIYNTSCKKNGPLLTQKFFLFIVLLFLKATLAERAVRSSHNNSVYLCYF